MRVTPGQAQLTRPKSLLFAALGVCSGLIIVYKMVVWHKDALLFQRMSMVPCDCHKVKLFVWFSMCPYIVSAHSFHIMCVCAHGATQLASLAELDQSAIARCRPGNPQCSIDIACLQVDCWLVLRRGAVFA